MNSNALGTERGWWARAFTPVLANEGLATRKINRSRVTMSGSKSWNQVPFPLQMLNDAGPTSHELIEELRKDGILSYLIEEGREAEFCKLWGACISLSDAGHNLEACILVIKYWLGDCWNRHQVCCSEPEGWVPELPRRLVYLGEVSTTPFKEIRIIDTANHTNLQYIAVSYRWPTDAYQNQQLNKHTRDEFYRGYPASRLLPCYADTFKVAAMLGIQFVWIDALCIMQDADREWHAEASKLASVYGNSVLTLAFGDGPDLSPIDIPCSRENCRLDDAVAAAFRLFLKGTMTDFDRRNPESVYSWLEVNDNFPTRPEGDIDRRGWTFQERLLSKRILSITENGFFWDCCRLNAADSRPLGLRGDFSPKFRDLEERKLKNLLLTKLSDRDILPRSDIYLLWRRILQQYTHRKFTHDRDRLVALEGVVKRLKVVINDDCFLGIWKGDVLRSLVWFGDGPPDYQYTWTMNGESPESKIFEIKTPELKVPSWSWASVYPKIGYRLWHPYQRYTEHNIEIVTPCAVLLGIHAGPEGDTFSSYSGTICIKGPLSKHPPSILNSLGCTMILDQRPWESRNEHNDGRTPNPFTRGGRNMGDRLQPEEKEKDIYVLLILKGGYSTNLQAYYYLVLRDADPIPLDGPHGRRPKERHSDKPWPDGSIPSQQMQFQRIGLFVVDCVTRHDFCLNDPELCDNKECVNFHTHIPYSFCLDEPEHCGHKECWSLYISRKRCSGTRTSVRIV